MVSDWAFVSVDVELTNRCMSNCVICPREAISRSTGFMTEETFEKVSQKLVEEGSLITFSGMGDPLLHPRVFEWIHAVRSGGGTVGIVVNPHGLHNDNAGKLVNARPNAITLSFPSVQKEVFERLCRNISYPEALVRAKELIGLSGGKVGLRVVGIETDINRGESEEFVRFWKNMGVSSRMVACHGRGGNVKAEGIYTSEPVETKSVSCGLFAFHTFVSWKGEVLACCHDLTGSTVIGNLAALDLSSIVKRKKEIILKGAMPFSLCSQCDEPMRRCLVPQGIPPADRNARNRFFRKVSQNAKNSL